MQGFEFHFLPVIRPWVDGMWEGKDITLQRYIPQKGVEYAQASDSLSSSQLLC